MADRWPRLMPREVAAEYCGVSANHFLAHVQVPPRMLGAKKLWDRKALDAWIDKELAGEETDGWDRALAGV